MSRTPSSPPAAIPLEPMMPGAVAAKVVTDPVDRGSPTVSRRRNFWPGSGLPSAIAACVIDPSALPWRNGPPQALAYAAERRQGQPRSFRQGGADVRFPFFTIGHSTRSIEEFVDLLRVGEVSLVVDIRTVRRSRRNPQYNWDALPVSLAPFGIRYGSIPELGGLRKRALDTPFSRTPSGTIGVSTIMRIMRSPNPSEKGSNSSRRWGGASVARSCARRPSGGAVIGGSSQTICSFAARKSST